MSSKAEYMRQYRLKNTEYREKEKERDREYAKTKYNTDEAYKQRKIENALARYYKMKEMKQSNTISCI